MLLILLRSWSIGGKGVSPCANAGERLSLKRKKNVIRARPDDGALRG